MGTAPDGKGKRDILCWSKLVSDCRQIRSNPELLAGCVTLCTSSLCLLISGKKGTGLKDGNLLPGKAACLL